MAKKADTIQGSFSLENLKKASQKRTEKKEVKEDEHKKKPYGIQFMVSTKLINDFKNLFFNFLYETNKDLASHYFFFRIVLLDIIETKKISEEKYKDDNILNIIYRKGRRSTTNDYRICNSDDMNKLYLGRYTDNTDELYDLVMCYYSKKNKEHIQAFTKAFFFYDIIEYLEENIDKLIEKHKK